MQESNGFWFLAVICCLPFLAGVLSTVVVLVRYGQLGWWGLLPFGGTFKNWWMEKQG